MGSYGGAYSSPSPVEPPANAPGPSMYPAMAPGPFVGGAPAPVYTNPFAAGTSQTPPAPQNPTLSQQLGGTPVGEFVGQAWMLPLIPFPCHAVDHRMMMGKAAKCKASQPAGKIAACWLVMSDMAL